MKCLRVESENSIFIQEMFIFNKCCQLQYLYNILSPMNKKKLKKSVTARGCVLGWNTSTWVRLSQTLQWMDLAQIFFLEIRKKKHINFFGSTKKSFQEFNYIKPASIYVTKLHSKSTDINPIEAIHAFPVIVFIAFNCLWSYFQTILLIVIKRHPRPTRSLSFDSAMQNHGKWRINNTEIKKRVNRSWCNEHLTWGSVSLRVCIAL